MYNFLVGGGGEEVRKLYYDIIGLDMRKESLLLSKKIENQFCESKKEDVLNFFFFFRKFITEK